GRRPATPRAKSEELEVLATSELLCGSRDPLCRVSASSSAGRVETRTKEADTRRQRVASGPVRCARGGPALLHVERLLGPIFAGAGAVLELALDLVGRHRVRRVGDDRAGGGVG